MAADIITKLTEVAKNLRPEAEVAAGKNFQDDLDFDSLDMISLYFDLEKAFDIKISEEDISEYNLVSVDNIVKFIKKIKAHEVR